MFRIHFFCITYAAFQKLIKRQDIASLQKSVWSVIEEITRTNDKSLTLTRNSDDWLQSIEDKVLVLHFSMKFPLQVHPARTISFFGKLYK